MDDPFIHFLARYLSFFHGSACRVLEAHEAAPGVMLVKRENLHGRDSPPPNDRTIRPWVTVYFDANRFDFCGNRSAAQTVITLQLLVESRDGTTALPIRLHVLDWMEQDALALRNVLEAQRFAEEYLEASSSRAPWHIIPHIVGHFVPLIDEYHRAAIERRLPEDIVT